MSIAKKVAIVLGGTSPHVALINNLKRRGYFTILIDFTNDSPGSKVADEYIKESTLNKEVVLNIAREKKAKLVISTCIDQANSTCCYVAEKLGLPKPYDYQTSLNVTNKGLMKRIMVDNKIKTAQYFLVSNIEEVPWDKVEYPMVVKPVDCNSSKGVHRVDNKVQLLKYLREAISISRTGQAIVEEFSLGFEIQVDCYAKESEAIVLMTRQKKKIESKEDMVLQSKGSVIPALLNEFQRNKVEAIANEIATAFRLVETPFFFQAIVNDNQINVLELAPRIGGGLSYYLIKEICGFDILDAAIESFIGKKVDVTVEKNEKIFSTNLLYVQSGIFDQITGMEELKKKGIIKEFVKTKAKGTIIEDDISSGNRVGAFVIEAKSYEQLQTKESTAYKNIEAYNAQGQPILKRDI